MKSVIEREARLPCKLGPIVDGPAAFTRKVARLVPLGVLEG